MKTISRVIPFLGALLPMALLAQTPAQTPAPTPAAAQGAPGQRAGGAPAGPRLAVTSSAWPDGAEIPMKFASRAGGENKSPAFEFQWFTGTAPSAAPTTLQSYAVIFHDVENSTMRGTVDTLHWSAFNIPGTATGLPEGIAAGDQPDGTMHGPGLGRRQGGAGSYFGPGAGPGPIHHYVFEFYALDTKLTLPGTATRDELLKAMEGHVIGKAAYFGRFHGATQP